MTTTFRLDEDTGMVTIEHRCGIGNLTEVVEYIPLPVQPFCPCADRCACLDDPWFSGRVGRGDPHAGRL